jgi:hypothetical protein
LGDHPGTCKIRSWLLSDTEAAEDAAEHVFRNKKLSKQKMVPEQRVKTCTYHVGHIVRECFARGDA